MSSQYILDDNYKLKKAKKSVWATLRRILIFLVASVSMAVLYYLVFALVFSTDEEKRLRQENKAYQEELPMLEEKERLLSDVVEGLKIRDDRIYEEIFHASAPNVDPINAIDILSGLDTIPDKLIVKATEDRLKQLDSRAEHIERNFMGIAALEQIENKDVWNSICAWGPTALLPIFQLLGTNYKTSNICSFYLDKDNHFDLFTKSDFTYDSAVASIKVGRGVKSEGDLVVTGTKGYIYVPAPWWKTDYFEVRYEQQEANRRYYYQLDGEGIRYELVAFMKAIKSGRQPDYIPKDVALQVTSVLEDFYQDKVTEIQ